MARCVAGGRVSVPGMGSKEGRRERVAHHARLRVLPVVAMVVVAEEEEAPRGGLLLFVVEPGTLRHWTRANHQLTQTQGRAV